MCEMGAVDSASMCRWRKVGVRERRRAMRGEGAVVD